MDVQQEKQEELCQELEALRQRLHDLEMRSGKSPWRLSKRVAAGGVLLAGLSLVVGGVLYGQDIANALFIDSRGNVGLGTTTPTAMLNVGSGQNFGGITTLGVVQRSSDSVGLSLRKTGANPVFQWCSDAGCTYVEQANANNNLLLGSNGTGGAPAMVVQQGANVGIGTTSPTSRLDVQQGERTGTHPTGRSLYVTGDFAPDSGVEFRHSNGSQGIGFGYNTIYATGSYADQDLSLSARGRGNIILKSLATLQGRYQRDDQPETTQTVSPRYHLSLTATNYKGSTKTIPQNILVDLCGDADGCEIRLGMTRWDTAATTETASRSFLFYYSNDNGHWRSSAEGGETLGVDGANGTQHVKVAWDTCFFTDGTYSGYRDQGDTVRGMQLLVWNKYNGNDRTCELTIID